MAGRRVALIIFFDTEHRILLQDRRSIAKRGEEWGFFGGGIEEGETPEETVVRETEEELGHTLTDAVYIGTVTNTHNEYTIERHVFIAPLADRLAGFHLQEGDNLRLFTIPEARGLKMVQGDEGVLDLLENQFSG